MARSIDRRTFLKAAGTSTVALLGVPLLPSRSAAQSDKLVVAVGQWGIETPFAWRSSQSEKTLWDCVYDSLITRDPKTFASVRGWPRNGSRRTRCGRGPSSCARACSSTRGCGEMTAEDVKFTIEQNLKPDSPGGSAPFFRINLDRIEIPDKYTIVHALQESPVGGAVAVHRSSSATRTSRRRSTWRSVGEEKAALHPIGTGPYRHVEGRQGDYHRFEAVPKHWRQTPAFKELVVRRIPDAAARLAGLRTGEIDVGQVFGDYLDQAQKSGLRIHETREAVLHWVVLSGQTVADKEDFCPTCPWAGDYNDKKSQENARKVRLALNLAVDKKAIINGLWRGRGSETPFSYFYYPFHKGYSKDWKIPAHDPEPRPRKLLAEAGHAWRLRGARQPDGLHLRARRQRHDGGRGAGLGEGRDQGQARARELRQLPAQEPHAQDQQDPLGLRRAALRRARPGLAALHPHQGRVRRS